MALQRIRAHFRLQSASLAISHSQVQGRPQVYGQSATALELARLVENSTPQPELEQTVEAYDPLPTRRTHWILPHHTWIGILYLLLLC